MSIVNIEAHQVEDNKLELVCMCLLCGNVNKMIVDKEGFLEGMNKYQSGMCVQDAFPTWSAKQREFILTGNCSCLWG